MKKGFTLVELLAVIAIIGILSVLVVPSIININKGINERLLASKKEEISSNAELYANNNEDLFNGTNEAYIYVWELIDANYVSVDTKYGSDNCTESRTTKGCVINPVSKQSMNEDYVILTRQGAGVTSEYVSMGDGTTSQGVNGDTLVNAVCNIFKNEKTRGNAYVGDSIVPCKCSDTADSQYPNNPAKLVDNNGQEVSACLLSGTDVNNHLRYGNLNSNNPNWRVLGLYMVDGHITAKMITSGAV